MGVLLSHSPGDKGNRKEKALFGDQALKLKKGALQSRQTSWYNQQWALIDLENQGLAHSHTDLWERRPLGNTQHDSSEGLRGHLL